MRYSFWYGRQVHACDESWVADAVTSLQKNEWKPSSPLYVDGQSWAETRREDAAVDLLQALSGNQTAKSLVMRNATMESRAQQALADVFQKNTHLQSVSLRSLRTAAGQEIEIPSSLFQKNPSLRDLTLEKCILNRTSSLELAKMLTSSKSHVTSLTLDNVQMEGGLGACFAKALSDPACSLQKLTVRNRAMSVADGNCFLQAVRGNTSLRALHVEGCHLNVQHAAALAELLRHNAHLQELSLRKNDLDHVAIDTIFGNTGLGANQSLRTLLLSHNPVGDEGVASIVQSLSASTSSLQRLCLAHCEIWSGGCRQIAAGLGQIKSLRHLALDGNALEPCAADFLRALESGNRTLIELVQSLPLLLRNIENELDETELDQWKEVAAYLKFNKAGRRVLSEPTASDLLPLVLQKNNKDMDTVFMFLQNHAWTSQASP